MLSRSRTLRPRLNMPSVVKNDGKDPGAIVEPSKGLYP